MKKETVVLSSNNCYFVKFNKEDISMWTTDISLSKRFSYPSREFNNYLFALFMGDSQEKITITMLESK